MYNTAFWSLRLLKVCCIFYLCAPGVQSVPTIRTCDARDAASQCVDFSDTDVESFETDEASSSDNFSVVDYGSDIIGRTGITDSEKIWSHMFVNVSTDLDKHQKVFEQVFRVIEMILPLPCLELKSSYNSSRTSFDYIHVEKSDKCNVNIGKTGGEQIMNLTPKCASQFNTVLRMFLKALGLAYEHNSPDRDVYVKVFWDNIEPGYENQFYKVTRPEYATYSQPYNPNSVMHFTAREFSVNKMPTTMLTEEGKYNAKTFNKRYIIKDYPSNWPASRLQLTDVKKLQLMYNCYGRTVRN